MTNPNPNPNPTPIPSPSPNPKVRRVGDGALALAKSLPLSTRAVAAVKGLDTVVRFGRLGVAGLLLREDLLNMLLLLRRIAEQACLGLPLPLPLPLLRCGL